MKNGSILNNFEQSFTLVLKRPECIRESVVSKI